MGRAKRDRPPRWAALVLGLLTLVFLSLAVFAWTRGWVFPAVLLLAGGLLLGWVWVDNHLIYRGPLPSGDSEWRGPAPHEGWIENQSDRDAWIGGG